MAPSAVNDSARGMMAAVAQYRDDIAGAIVTGGTNVAFSLSSFSSFDTLLSLDKQIIAFTPHTSNGGPCTLNCDALGPKPLRSAPGVDLSAGTIIFGTPYMATYNHTDGAFYLHGFYGSPYAVPLGGLLSYTGFSPPNSAFVFPFGQAISRVTYSAYFSLVGVGFGAGDGSTTFNVINMVGRVEVTSDALSGSPAGVMVGVGNNTAGGSTNASVILAGGNLPAHTHSGSGRTSGMTANKTHTHVYSAPSIGSGTGSTPNYFNSSSALADTFPTDLEHGHDYAFITNGGNGLTNAPFSTAMPFRGVNKLLRVI